MKTDVNQLVKGMKYEEILGGIALTLVIISSIMTIRTCIHQSNLAKLQLAIEEEKNKGTAALKNPA